MKEGDFVKIDYIGRIKESGTIFDITNEKIAKEKEVYNPQVKYGPVPVIVGAKFVIKGLEEQIKKMEVGEEKKFTLKPEDAFGKRSEKLLKVIPITEFHKRNVVPYQGMPVNIKNMMGRVASVSGGRVKVDFNHPLAGKELEYEMKVTDKITDKKEKIAGIVEFLYGKNKKDDIELKENIVKISLKPLDNMDKKVKQYISDQVFKWISDIKKTIFVEEFENKPSDNKKTDTK